MSYPILHGDQPKGRKVKCVACGTEVHLPPHQLVTECPKCQARVTLPIPDQTYQRGPQ